MRLVFRQTPRTFDRIIGCRLVSGKVEFLGYNEEGQQLYTVIIDKYKFIIFDAVGNKIATLKKDTWKRSRRCDISAVNGVQGVLERKILLGTTEYAWSYGGYRIHGEFMGLHYNVFQNECNVMHIIRQMQDFRAHYWIDIANPGCMLEGVLIVMAIALMNTE